jgi:hypothetical protein
VGSSRWEKRREPSDVELLLDNTVTGIATLRGLQGSDLGDPRTAVLAWQNMQLALRNLAAAMAADRHATIDHFQRDHASLAEGFRRVIVTFEDQAVDVMQQWPETRSARFVEALSRMKIELPLRRLSRQYAGLAS